MLSQMLLNLQILGMHLYGRCICFSATSPNILVQSPRQQPAIMLLTFLWYIMNYLMVRIILIYDCTSYQTIFRTNTAKPLTMGRPMMYTLTANVS